MPRVCQPPASSAQNCSCSSAAARSSFVARNRAATLASFFSASFFSTATARRLEQRRLQPVDCLRHHADRGHELVDGPVGGPEELEEGGHRLRLGAENG